MFDLENKTWMPQQLFFDASQRSKVILKTGARNGLEILKTFRSTAIHQIKFASVEILVGFPTVEHL